MTSDLVENVVNPTVVENVVKEQPAEGVEMRELEDGTWAEAFVEVLTETEDEAMAKTVERAKFALFEERSFNYLHDLMDQQEEEASEQALMEGEFKYTNKIYIAEAKEQFGVVRFSPPPP